MALASQLGSGWTTRRTSTYSITSRTRISTSGSFSQATPLPTSFRTTMRRATTWGRPLPCPQQRGRREPRQDNNNTGIALNTSAGITVSNNKAMDSVGGPGFDLLLSNSNTLDHNVSQRNGQGGFHLAASASNNLNQNSPTATAPWLRRFLRLQLQRHVQEQRPRQRCVRRSRRGCWQRLDKQQLRDVFRDLTYPAGGDVQRGVAAVAACKLPSAGSRSASSSRPG